MKACLNCGQDYKNKRDSSKFCSDKCRVYFNRKNPKPKESVSLLQMQVLYNEMLDWVGKMKHVLPADYMAVKNIEILKEIGQVEPISFTKPKAPKTMAQYFEGKRECTCEDDYHQWVADVEADPYLSTKQKQILKTTNPSSL